VPDQAYYFQISWKVSAPVYFYYFYIVGTEDVGKLSCCCSIFCEILAGDPTSIGWVGRLSGSGGCFQIWISVICCEPLYFYCFVNVGTHPVAPPITAMVFHFFSTRSRDRFLYGAVPIFLFPAAGYGCAILWLRTSGSIP
jgi:hypothetical protein